MWRPSGKRKPQTKAKTKTREAKTTKTQKHQKRKQGSRTKTQPEGHPTGPEFHLRAVSNQTIEAQLNESPKKADRLRFNVHGLNKLQGQ